MYLFVCLLFLPEKLMMDCIRSNSSTKLISMCSFCSTSCSTSTCTTSCSTPYVIFETNSLPYVQRTTITERDASNTTTTCIDDSGGGGGGGNDNTPVDNNNIGDDNTDSAATELNILKRATASALQRQRDTCYEHVDQVIENEDDDDDTSQGMCYFIYFICVKE